MEQRHCDDFIRDKTQPMCLRRFLAINRAPAMSRWKWVEKNGEPILFATIRKDLGQDFRKHCEKYGFKEGQRVRVVMASRLGDVGISPRFDQEHGYDVRVYVDWLENFSETA